MKAMMLGFVAIIVISVGSYFVLQGVGLTAQARYSGDAVRLE